MDIRKIIRIHNFVSNMQTGSPKQLALKLNLSERMVYNYIAFMREELKAPIVYNNERLSYCYERECGLRFEE